MSTVVTTSLSDLHDQAVAGILTYLTGDLDSRTPALKSVAEATTKARQHFFGADGEPDWLGRSNAYRTWVSSTVAKAGVPDDQRNTLQSGVRYHAGSVIRELLGPEKVAELGLSERSPRERSTVSRARAQAVSSLFSGGAPIDDPEEVLRMVHSVAASVRRVTAGSLGALTRSQREELRDLLLVINGRLSPA